MGEGSNRDECLAQRRTIYTCNSGNTIKRTDRRTNVIRNRRHEREVRRTSGGINLFCMGSALKLAKNALSSQPMLPARIFHEPTEATDNVRDIKPSCDSQVQKFAYELGIWRPLH